MNPLEAKTLGEFLARVREREELTQEEMARRLDQHRNSIQKAESDKTDRPYEYLGYILKWLTEAEIAHMLELLRQVDIKYLTRDRGISLKVQSKLEKIAPNSTRKDSGSADEP